MIHCGECHILSLVAPPKTPNFPQSPKLARAGGGEREEKGEVLFCCVTTVTFEIGETNLHVLHSALNSPGKERAHVAVCQANALAASQRVNPLIHRCYSRAAAHGSLPSEKLYLCDFHLNVVGSVIQNMF